MSGPCRTHEGAAIGDTSPYTRASTARWAAALQEALAEISITVKVLPVTSSTPGVGIEQRLELGLTPRQAADLIAALKVLA